MGANSLSRRIIKRVIYPMMTEDRYAYFVALSKAWDIRAGNYPEAELDLIPLAVHAGDTVHWVWQSTSVPHTVTSGTAPSADGNFCSNGGAQSAAACGTAAYARTAPFTFDHTFTAAGSFPYFCEIHGAPMSGTVTVQ